MMTLESNENEKEMDLKTKKKPSLDFENEKPEREIRRTKLEKRQRESWRKIELGEKLSLGVQPREM